MADAARQEGAALAEPALARRGHRGTWSRLRTKTGFWLGSSLLCFLIVAAVAAPLISPADPVRAHRDGGLTAAGDPVGPSERFPLGTDRLGRDYLSRLLHGARTSLSAGVTASLLATLIGVLVGAGAAMAGTIHTRLLLPGRRAIDVIIPLESMLMRLTDAVLAFPILLLAIALAAIVGGSFLLVVVLMAGFLWTLTARIVHGRVSSLKEREFVEAARAVGVSPLRILVRHILPHTSSLVVAYAALGIAGAILFETTLSYLGVGIPPPAPSWGSMIADHVSYYASDPRLLMLPGGAVMLTVLSFNLVGDALRDALDPHLANQR